MSWKPHGVDVKVLLAGLGVLALLLAAKSILEERDAKVRLDAELKATKQLLQAKDRDLQSINRTMEERDKKTASLVKEIELLRARPATIQEIAREIPHYVPLVTPPTFVPQTPTAPPKIEFTEPQAQDLRLYYLDCQAKTLKLEACTENEADWKRKELTWQEKEAILKQQRDAAVAAVHGGTFWQRFKRNGKWVLVTAATGVAAYEIGKHRK